MISISTISWAVGFNNGRKSSSIPKLLANIVFDAWCYFGCRIGYDIGYNNMNYFHPWWPGRHVLLQHHKLVSISYLKWDYVRIHAVPQFSPGFSLLYRIFLHSYKLFLNCTEKYFAKNFEQSKYRLISRMSQYSLMPRPITGALYKLNQSTRIVIAIKGQIKPLGLCKLSERTNGIICIEPLNLLSSQLDQLSTHDAVHTAQELLHNVMARTY